jgi:hypothetical protein
LISVWSWNFKDGGSLKVRFLAKNQHTTKAKKILQRITLHQKLGLILESKVVQKLSLEKNNLPKNGPLN